MLCCVPFFLVALCFGNFFSWTLLPHLSCKLSQKGSHRPLPRCSRSAFHSGYSSHEAVQSRLLAAAAAPAPVLIHPSACTLLTPWAGPGQADQRASGRAIHSCPQRLRARFSLSSGVGSEEGRAGSSSSGSVSSFPEGCVRLPTQCQEGGVDFPWSLLALHPGYSKTGGPSAAWPGLGNFVFLPHPQHAPWTGLVPSS